MYDTEHIHYINVHLITATKGFRNDYSYSVQADGWFKVHTIPVNWNRARLICHYEGTLQLYITYIYKK